MRARRLDVLTHIECCSASSSYSDDLATQSKQLNNNLIDQEST
jgi:hypothetical protein